MQYRAQGNDGLIVSFSPYPAMEPVSLKTKHMWELNRFPICMVIPQELV